MANNGVYPILNDFSYDNSANILSTIINGRVFLESIVKDSLYTGIRTDGLTMIY